MFKKIISKIKKLDASKRGTMFLGSLVILSTLAFASFSLFVG